MVDECLIRNWYGINNWWHCNNPASFITASSHLLKVSKWLSNRACLHTLALFKLGRECFSFNLFTSIFDKLSKISVLLHICKNNPSQLLIPSNRHWNLLGVLRYFWLLFFLIFLLTDSIINCTMFDHVTLPGDYQMDIWFSFIKEHYTISEVIPVNPCKFEYFRSWSYRKRVQF